MSYPNSFNARISLPVGEKNYTIFSLPNASKNGLGGIESLPYCLKVLLENNLRKEDGIITKKENIIAFRTWLKHRHNPETINYFPTRIMMPDSSGVPLVADMAAMRDKALAEGIDPARVNPVRPFDLIMDHSVTAEFAGTPDAFGKNLEFEFANNAERYKMAKWAQTAFSNIRVLPPGQGILHQINLESLARVVWSEDDEEHGLIAFPDSLVGGDSHTPMINGLSVLGWGVGGIEAMSAALGQPISMVLPDVVGMRLVGHLREGVTSTDLVLAITKRLREVGVVQKFVEFFGPAVDLMSMPDRATIANMCPEYGASLGFFPIDKETISFLQLTGREEFCDLVEAYAKHQGLWRDDKVQRLYSQTFEFDLKEVETSVAGPSRPQQLVPLGSAHISAKTAIETQTQGRSGGQSKEGLNDGDIVIAAITSCTNTSNPSVMLAAGLLAKKACALGLKSKPWVKTSLSPGSRIVHDYLNDASLMGSLEELGFHVVGYGCMTCGGNSGSLGENIEADISQKELSVCAVVSSNRNFEGRIHPSVKMAYIASPPLVVAYAIAGNMCNDMRTEPLGNDTNGDPVFLRDIWPTTSEIEELMRKHVRSSFFKKRYKDITSGPELWNLLKAPVSKTYKWDPQSTYIRQPPFLDTAKPKLPPKDIKGAVILGIFGDHLTTDHISPACNLTEDMLAGKYLSSKGVLPREFSGYTQRRVNHGVMMRGAFNNPRIVNEMTPELVGGWTKVWPTGKVVTIYEASEFYKKSETPSIVVAGKEYGTGSSRDWAAKSPFMLGVSAIIAESFERIHRSNLTGMAVLPLQFKDGETRKSWQLDGSEILSIIGLNEDLEPGQELKIKVEHKLKGVSEKTVVCRLDTHREIEWYKAGGVMPYVLNGISNQSI